MIPVDKIEAMVIPGYADYSRPVQGRFGSGVAAKLTDSFLPARRFRELPLIRSSACRRLYHTLLYVESQSSTPIYVLQPC